MIRIDYSYTNYEDLFKYVTRALNLKVKDSVGVLPPSMGQGKVELILLNNGLQVILYDYLLNEDVLYHRKKTEDDFYILRIDEFENQEESMKSALFFSHGSNGSYFMTPSKARLKTMQVYIPRNYLQSMLINEQNGEMILANLLLNSPAQHYELLDAEYRRLLYDILSFSSNKDYKNFTVYNRIMLMLERFFSRYYRKISETGKTSRASANELQRLKIVESEILKDFSYTPPNINQLSRMAAMSPSKLKLIFKEVFGMPVYQYYQKHRLQKGKAMLITRKYSIKEVAAELGYTHVKDFSRAFQKHFDQMPEELIKQ